MGLVTGSFALYDVDIAGTLGAVENYPGKKRIWIVPVKPGNGLDTLVRFLAPHLARAFGDLRGTAGQGIIIDNVPGADGSKAYARIFNAAPNGDTFGDFKLGFIPESIRSRPDFDPRRFTFLLRTGASIQVIATRKEGFKNWDRMLQTAREKDIPWAAGEFGRITHIESIIATQTMGIKAKLLNFPSTADTINALLKGDAQAGLFYLDGIAALLKAGEFRLLTVFAEKTAFPGVPSVSELGHPDLAESIREQRYLVGPPDIPSHIARVISTAFQKVLAKPEVVARAERLGLPILPLYGEAAAQAARQVITVYDKMAPTILKYLH